MGVEVISDKNVAYVEFTNTAFDGKLYNVMLFLEVSKNTLMISFNCLTKAAKQWKKPVFEMMRSIRLISQEKDAEGRASNEL